VVALNCGTGSRSLNAEVNAFESDKERLRLELIELRFEVLPGNFFREVLRKGQLNSWPKCA